MENMAKFVSAYADEGVELRKKFFQQMENQIILASLVTAIALSRGRKLLICGNGGSAGDAQHIAGEFVNRFLMERPALSAIALTTDSSVMTAIANDYAYDCIFARQLEALGKKDDIFLAISTSGKSPNVLEALKTAREREIYTIGLTGAAHNPMNELCDISLNVPSSRTPLIQETHLACEHVYCTLVEELLFARMEQLRPWLEREVYPSTLA